MSEVSHELSPEEYNSFVDRFDLTGVDIVDLAGTRHALGQADNATFELEGGHQWVDGVAFVRFELQVHAVRRGPEGEEPVADLRVVLVLRFATEQGPSPDVPEPREEVLERFGATTATLVAQPFLRETLFTLTSKLGLEGVVLPLAKAFPNS